MNNGLQAPARFVGWDCDKMGECGDAIVILDLSLAIVSKPRCGSLHATINMATTSPTGAAFD